MKNLENPWLKNLPLMSFRFCSDERFNLKEDLGPEDEWEEFIFYAEKLMRIDDATGGKFTDELIDCLWFAVMCRNRSPSQAQIGEDFEEYRKGKK